MKSWQNFYRDATAEELDDYIYWMFSKLDGPTKQRIGFLL